MPRAADCDASTYFSFAGRASYRPPRAPGQRQPPAVPTLSWRRTSSAAPRRCYDPTRTMPPHQGSTRGGCAALAGGGGETARRGLAQGVPHLLPKFPLNPSSWFVPSYDENEIRRGRRSPQSTCWLTGRSRSWQASGVDANSTFLIKKKKLPLFYFRGLIKICTSLSISTRGQFTSIGIVLPLHFLYELHDYPAINITQENSEV